MIWTGSSAIAVAVVFTTVVVMQLHAVPCNLRQFPAGLVCVCNETYCDTLDGPLTPVDRDHVIIVSSSKGGLRFNVQNHQFVRTRTSDASSSSSGDGDDHENSVDYQTTVRVETRRRNHHTRRRSSLDEPPVDRAQQDKHHKHDKHDKQNFTDTLGSIIQKDKPSHFLNKHNGTDCVCLAQQLNETALIIQLPNADNVTDLLLNHNKTGHHGLFDKHKHNKTSDAWHGLGNIIPGGGGNNTNGTISGGLSGGLNVSLPIVFDKHNKTGSGGHHGLFEKHNKTEAVLEGLLHKPSLNGSGHHGLFDKHKDNVTDLLFNHNKTEGVLEGLLHKPSHNGSGHQGLFDKHKHNKTSDAWHGIGNIIPGGGGNGTNGTISGGLNVSLPIVFDKHNKTGSGGHHGLFEKHNKTEAVLAGLSHKPSHNGSGHHGLFDKHKDNVTDLLFNHNKTEGVLEGLLHKPPHNGSGHQGLFDKHKHNKTSDAWHGIGNIIPGGGGNGTNGTIAGIGGLNVSLPIVFDKHKHDKHNHTFANGSSLGDIIFGKHNKTDKHGHKHDIFNLTSIIFALFDKNNGTLNKQNISNTIINHFDKHNITGIFIEILTTGKLTIDFKKATNKVMAHFDHHNITGLVAELLDKNNGTIYKEQITAAILNHFDKFNITGIIGGLIDKGTIVKEDLINSGLDAVDKHNITGVLTGILSGNITINKDNLTNSVVAHFDKYNITGIIGNLIDKGNGTLYKPNLTTAIIGHFDKYNISGVITALLNSNTTIDKQNLTNAVVNHFDKYNLTGAIGQFLLNVNGSIDKQNLTNEIINHFNKVNLTDGPVDRFNVSGVNIATLIDKHNKTGNPLHVFDKKNVTSAIGGFLQKPGGGISIPILLIEKDNITGLVTGTLTGLLHKNQTDVPILIIDKHNITGLWDKKEITWGSIGGGSIGGWIGGGIDVGGGGNTTTGGGSSTVGPGDNATTVAGSTSSSGSESTTESMTGGEGGSSTETGSSTSGGDMSSSESTTESMTGGEGGSSTEAGASTSTSESTSEGGSSTSGGDMSSSESTSEGGSSTSGGDMSSTESTSEGGSSTSDGDMSSSESTTESMTGGEGGSSTEAGASTSTSESTSEGGSSTSGGDMSSSESTTESMTGGEGGSSTEAGSSTSGGDMSSSSESTTEGGSSSGSMSSSSGTESTTEAMTGGGTTVGGGSGGGISINFNITGNFNKHPINKPVVTDVFGHLESFAESLLDKHKNKTHHILNSTPAPANTNESSSTAAPAAPSADTAEAAATPQLATVRVDRTRRFQSITGFGGAYTGAVTYLMQRAPPALADALYTMYYSLTRGIGYTMMRLPIGGSDFDLAPWAYNEQPADDVRLSNFYALDRRDLDRIVQLRRLASVTGNANVRLVGAAWSPPPWMKTNGEWSGFGVLRPEYYRTWADYHLRYLRLMETQGVRFWAISTGNEPLNGIIGWVFVHFMSLGWTAPAQGVWVGDHLGPVLRNSSMASVKLLGADDQRYVFPWWFEKMEEAHPRSVDYLDGFAVHWYWDKLAPASLLDQTAARWPDKVLLNTESCIGDKPFQVHGPLLGSWERAEEYVKGYMEDLQHSVNGWIDWNLVLDEHGGPNYTNNTVDAPVILNLPTKELYKQPMFYAIGHFSRFVLPNSVRLDVQSLHPSVLAIGFLRPDQSVALVLYNKAESPMSIVIRDDGRNIELAVPGKSIHSVVYL